MDLAVGNQRKTSGFSSTPFDGPVHSDEFQGTQSLGEFLHDEESKESPGPQQTASELEQWLEYVTQDTGSTLSIAKEVEKKKKFFIKTEKYYMIRVYKEAANMQYVGGENPQPPNNGMHIDTKRKFKEFKVFQNALRDRFTGAMVPSLPKSALADEKMVEVLDHFMREVARNPVFKRDAVFETFCSPQIAKFNSDSTRHLPFECEGLNQWKEMLMRVPLPPNVHDFLKEAAKEISTVHSVYTSMREALLKMQTTIQRQARDQREMAKTWEKWNSKEAGFNHLFGRASDPTRSWGFDDAIINMPGVLHSMHELAEGRAHSLEQEATESLNVIQTKLSFEIQILEELEVLVAEVKASMHKHRISMREFGNLRTKLQASEQQLIASQPFLDGDDDDGFAESHTGNPSSPGSAVPNKKQARLQVKAEHLQETIRARQGDVKKLVRGLRYEMDRYRFERTVRMADMSRTLGQIQNNHLQDVVRMCSNSLSTLPPKQVQVAPLACILDYAEREKLARQAARAAAASIAAGSPGMSPPFESGDSRRSLRVLFNFTAEEDGEISLREGDIVEAVRPIADDNGWCEVRTHDGRVGLAPVSYLEPEIDDTAPTLDPVPPRIDENEALSPGLDTGFASPVASPVASPLSSTGAVFSFPPSPQSNSGYDHHEGNGATGASASDEAVPAKHFDFESKDPDTIIQEADKLALRDATAPPPAPVSSNMTQTYEEPKAQPNDLLQAIQQSSRSGMM